MSKDAPKDMTTEQLHAALAHYRDGQFAVLVAAAVALAARTHPEQIREALACVFVLKELERHAGISSAKCQAAAEMAGRLTAQGRELLAAVDKDIARIELRMDCIREQI